MKMSIKEQFREYLANCVQTRRQTGNTFIIGRTTVDSYVSFVEVDKLFDYAPEKWQKISSIYDITSSNEILDIIEVLLNDDSFKTKDTAESSQYFRSNAIKQYYCFLKAREIFIGKRDLNDQVSNDNLPLQQIFYGAPGTGKSHKIKDDADVKAADKKNLVFRTTFHPDSDYSTFVGCYKPTTSKSGIRGKQPILDYDSLVDKFKEYLNVPNVNITKACTLFGFDYHDSIIRIQENGRKVMDLVNDGYKSNTSYDSVGRGGMACYEQNSIQENDSKITYEFIPQAFTNAYVKAWNTDENVYLIIEEINRGNCAEIFGDLFQLLDRKNGLSEYPVEADTDLQNYLCKALTDTKRTDIPDDVKSGKKLVLPSNLYIWATMNTSDQSLFPIDSAFKRRWEWKYIKIKEGKDENGNKLDWKVDVKMDEAGTLLPWWDFIKKINEIIASMTSSADKQLGYFFCCAKDGVIDEETFVSKVIFYLWNDVFKDYGFEDASLFRYTAKDEDGKEMEKDLTFPDFYDEEGEKVNTEHLTDFVKKVMNWKKTNAEQD